MTPAPRSQDEVEFAGLTFRGLHLEDVMPGERFKFVVTVNADLIVTSTSDARFRRIISENISTFDGQVTWWLAKLLAKPRDRTFSKISGSDVIYDLLRHTQQTGNRIFFLGASETSNSSAVRRARQEFSVAVDGYSPPSTTYPHPSGWSDEIAKRLAAFRPHVVLVALGSPRQEFWIDDNKQQLEALGVRLVIGCGGTLDFFSATLPRAPLFVQRIGLEGLYRLLKQPSWMRLKRLGRSLLIFGIALTRRA